MSIKKTLDGMSPASRSNGKIAAGMMASGAEIAIPYVAMKGAKSGPCLWINGQVHGNEINGTFAALDFFNELDAAKLSGSLVVTATANPPALDARRKFAPQDDQDLDQSYPGRADGFTTEQLAHALFVEMKAAANTVINMHTMSPPFEAKVYAGLQSASERAGEGKRPAAPDRSVQAERRLPHECRVGQGRVAR